MNLKTIKSKSRNRKIKNGIEKDITNLLSGNEKSRARAFSVLYPLSGSNPDKLYPYWDYFEEMLRKPEATNKYYAIHILANLASADHENKFERIYDLWFNELLNDESPVVSPHIAEKSGKIVLAKPELESKVTTILLNAEKRSRCRHKELLKGYILSALDLYFNLISRKNEVIEFIKSQVASSSPLTKTKARDLITKYKLC
jgi:hypothetical protein